MHVYTITCACVHRKQLPWCTSAFLFVLIFLSCSVKINRSLRTKECFIIFVWFCSLKVYIWNTEKNWKFVEKRNEWKNNEFDFKVILGLAVLFVCWSSSRFLRPLFSIFVFLASIFFLFGQHTMVDNSQKYRLKYWATRSSVRSFARTAHAFACSGRLASLVRSTALTRLLTCSLCSLPR